MERDLSRERKELFSILDNTGIEAAERLLSAIEEGRIDGHIMLLYQDEEIGLCGCILGHTLNLQQPGFSWYDKVTSLREKVSGYISEMSVESYIEDVELGDYDGEDVNQIKTWTEEWLENETTAC